MQLVSLAPGLLIGLWYGIQQGNWIFFASIAASFLVSIFLRRPMGRVLEAEVDELGSVRIDGRVVNRFPIFWTTQERDLVFQLLVTPTSDDLALALQRAEKMAKKDSLMNLGVTPSLAPVSIELSKSAPHLLIIGPTGSGKSVLMRRFAMSAQPLLDIDFKGGENLAGFLAVRRLNNLDQNSESFWKELDQRLDQREAKPHLKHPALYVFVDELAATLASSTQAGKTLERVATRGRSSSVFMIAASQSTSGIPRNIILNCQHRVLLGAVDPIDRTQLGAKTNRASGAYKPEQLAGEYLYQGFQTEFLLLKPLTSYKTISSVSTPGQNPFYV